MDVSRRLVVVLGGLVFAIAAIVYLVTLTRTVPFWDAGEFIAVSYILGIPHPPGTPFYVLLGRIATLVPWASVAERVNALSAIPAALAVLFTYLTTLRIVRLAQGPERGRTEEWIAQAGAVAGAWLFAFSDSFWENAIEAEVYALMSFAQILVLWLGLRWWEAHERQPTAGPLLLCVYVMWLCVGLHLGVGIMGLPLILLVVLVDRRAALVFAMPLLSVLFVTMGLERMAGAVIALSAAVFVVFAFQRKLGGWTAAAGAGAAAVTLPIAFGDQPFTPWTAALAVAAVLVPLVALARRRREGRIIALALALMVIGYSTHVYLPVRAAQSPRINEGNPSSWTELRDLLERRQYGSTSMFVRRGTLSSQLDKEFWRYFKRQWTLWTTAGDERRPVPPGAALPLALGVVGAVWLARRERVTFLTTGTFLLLTTAGLILFLNFSDREVRERDYFFQSGYHAYALWIGIGTAALLGWVRDSFAPGRLRTVAVAVGAVVLVAQPLLLLRTLWFSHDRRGDYVARDYAYNMLAPLAPGAFIFTNGDNDTFPLWYMQEVEGFRRDVRVVNLSLLNTDWYIRQLRDEEPRVPITLDDAAVRMLGAGLVQDAQGRYIYTNEFMVDHIMAMNRTADGGWRRPPYFAVTVPDPMGLDRHFTLEGLVYRVNPDTLGPRVDLEAIRRNLYDVFRYRGLFREDGSWDDRVFKDENSSTLSRNYASAHLQLASAYRRAGRRDEALAELDRVERMFPDLVDVLVPIGGMYLESGDTTRAAAMFTRLVRRHPADPEVRYYYGVTLALRHDLAGALAQFEAAMRLDPDYGAPYLAAYGLRLEIGERAGALAVLERWAERNPDDPQVRGLIERHRREWGLPPAGGARPVPPPPPGMR